MYSSKEMTDDANVRCNLRTSLRNAHYAKYLTFFMKHGVTQLHFSWRAALQYKVESEVFQYSVC